jgi:hypothetical protein
MRLLRFADVPASVDHRVFRYSRGRALAAVGLVLAAAGALLTRGVQLHAPVLYYIMGVLLTGLVVMQTFVRARFQPTNWLVRATTDGLFVQFRSYLNYRFPSGDTTVVWIPYGAIRSAHAVRERRPVPDVERSTRGADYSIVRRRTTVRLELNGDIAPLTRAIEDEIGRAVGGGNIGGVTKTRYRHVPVRMPSPGILQLDWAVTPDAAAFLALLRDHGVSTETAAATLDDLDVASLRALSRSEQEQRLAELVDLGDTIAAIHAARRLYGYDLTRAREFVEHLHGQRSGGQR